MPTVRSKVPRFDNLLPSSERASRTLSRVARSGTQCERMLRAELRRLGLTFRRNVSDLPGKPDIVFVAHRTVVFCDGDFWHGRYWKKRRERLQRGANAGYWLAKIESNRARDKRHVQNLRQLGWRVIRVWEGDIRKDAAGAAEKIVRALVSG